MKPDEFPNAPSPDNEKGKEKMTRRQAMLGTAGLYGSVVASVGFLAYGCMEAYKTHQAELAKKKEFLNTVGWQGKVLRTQIDRSLLGGDAPMAIIEFEGGERRKVWAGDNIPHENDIWSVKMVHGELYLDERK